MARPIQQQAPRPNPLGTPKLAPQLPNRQSVKAQPPKKGLASRIASFLGLSADPVTTRPISIRDKYQKGLPHHVAAPTRLSQLAQGARPSNRPSDVQLTQFLSGIIETK
ncbi:MAG: hypothetical protein HY539_04815 [Deltaproteobacteria bacterium]|nr:hypothetical protein [Deltaproteobacteria bacterium]MBI4197124.1 hypothetical protein [Deltaproteobacteria bacterium]